MNEKIKINLYRTPVDKAVMSDLMRKSDARAFAHVIPQLALFAHGTCSCFFGGTACHELCHKTPFKTAFWNEFFLKVYAFMSWFDPVAYRVSHVKHHQVTVHHDHDGEVELPQGLDWHGVKFVFWQLSPVVHPLAPYNLVKKWIKIARGDLSEGSWFFTPEWTAKILPEENLKLRQEHRSWARKLLIGHLLLAILFVATGNWILLLIVTFGCHYCTWLQLLCGAPQHTGMTPDVPDFRLCCRTFTCSWFPAFLYWNMQYHVEHHMFPAVPFYNLPRLRKAIEHDLPPAPHGLRATWKELVPILKRQRREPGYFFTHKLPSGEPIGTFAGDDMLRAEAAQ